MGIDLQNTALLDNMLEKIPLTVRNSGVLEGAGVFPGVTTKWLYCGARGTVFVQHVEDHFFSGWLYGLKGTKRMYVIDPSEDNIDKLSSVLGKEEILSLFSKQLLLKSCVLAKKYGQWIDITPGDLVYVHGVLHGGYNDSSCVAISTNVLTLEHVPRWYQSLKRLNDQIQFPMLKPLPLRKMLMSIIQNCMENTSNIAKVMEQEDSDYLRWKFHVKHIEIVPYCATFNIWNTRCGLCKDYLFYSYVVDKNDTVCCHLCGLYLHKYHRVQSRMKIMEVTQTSMALLLKSTLLRLAIYVDVESLLIWVKDRLEQKKNGKKGENVRTTLPYYIKCKDGSGKYGSLWEVRGSCAYKSAEDMGLCLNPSRTQIQSALQKINSILQRDIVNQVWDEISAIVELENITDVDDHVMYNDNCYFHIVYQYDGRSLSEYATSDLLIPEHGPFCMITIKYCSTKRELQDIVPGRLQHLMKTRQSITPNRNSKKLKQ